MGFLSKLFSKQKLPGIPASVQVSVFRETSAASQNNYEQLKQQGNALLNLGKYAEAELAYSSALQTSPNSCEAHINLGYVLSELSRTEEAKNCFDKAIELDELNFDAHLLRAMLALAENDPEVALIAVRNALQINSASEQAKSVLYKTLSMKGDFSQIEEEFKAYSSVAPGQANYHFDLSKVYSSLAGKNQNQNQQTALLLALTQSEKSVQIDPRNADMLHQQGLLYLALNRTDEALAVLTLAAASTPAHFDSLFVLGNVYRAVGNIDLALESLKKAVALKPLNEGVHKALGDVYYQAEAFSQAAVSYKTALDIEPKMFEAWHMLGSARCELEQYEPAIECCDRVIALSPNWPEAYFGLGNVLLGQNKYLQALEAFSKAIELRSDYADAIINKGSVLLHMGNYSEASDAFSQVVAMQPDHLMALTNLVYCSSFDAEFSAESYLNLACSWGALASSRAVPYQAWKCPPLSERPLKVGLVSGDLCLHPVGFFLENVAVHLDIEKIELHVFSNRVREDVLQLNLKALSSSWTSIVGIPDKEAAKLVHDAQIDLLIDLAGHTNRHRLSLFAWRAAPVQASWLGYWASTGVAEIDYLLADPHAVPTVNQKQFSERICYLTHTRMCFTPPSKAYELPVSTPPATKNGFVTFGSFQPVRKLTPAVLTLWGKVFNQVPTSRFRLQGSGFSSDAVRPAMLKRLAEVGIPEQSVILVDSVPRLEYFKAHADVDIILDSFPYPGGTTTCDALWMGVPTVTLAGNTMLSRQGVSIMTCAGLPDWVAQSEAEYIEIAVSKASDLALLANLRRQLRQSLFASPLFNAPAFAKDFESALQRMVSQKLQASSGDTPSVDNPPP